MPHLVAQDEWTIQSPAWAPRIAVNGYQPDLVVHGAEQGWVREANVLLTKSDYADVRGSARGLGLYAGSNGLSRAWVTSSLPSRAAAAEMTILCLVEAIGNGAGASNPRLFSVEPNAADSSPFTACSFYRNSSTTVTPAWNNAGTFKSGATFSFVNGETMCVALRVASGSVAWFKNGQRVGTSTDATSISFSVPTLIAGGCGGKGATSNTSLIIGAVWFRGISDGALSALTLNPWQLFEPEPIQIYWPSVGGATIIDLNSASFGFTGNSNQPAVRSSLTQASFDFTSNPIQPKTTVGLTAAAFNFTANAINLGGQTIIDLSRASFNFTANAINVVKDTVINLTTAAFNFVGKVINISTPPISGGGSGGGMFMALAGFFKKRRYRQKVGKNE